MADETQRDDEPSGTSESHEDESTSAEEQPLVSVRYGLGKELFLYPHEFVARQHEVDEEIRIRLEHIHRLIMLPGEYTPSKLVVMLELDDGTTLIVAEGMTNVAGFRRLLTVLGETHPEIELDPPNMDEQLMQALDIKRRSLLGCYGFILGSCILLWLIYLIVAFIGHNSVLH